MNTKHSSGGFKFKGNCLALTANKRRLVGSKIAKVSYSVPSRTPIKIIHEVKRIIKSMPSFARFSLDKQSRLLC